MNVESCLLEGDDTFRDGIQLAPDQGSSSGRNERSTMARVGALARILGLGSVLMLGVAPAACLSWDYGISLSRSEPLSPAEPGARRALIVAIADYAPGTGWWPISSDHDARLVRAALRGQGFSAIEVLTDEKATRAGIVEVFRRSLIDPARPGDLVVFHYSGHGQQITDDGGDEPDGYDEAIVPYDAPLNQVAGYEGDRHLRDDELDRLIQELRRKLGPRGHVAVFLDTCYSGTPRGNQHLERGGPPLGLPAPVGGGAEVGSGFYETSAARGWQISVPGQGALAPYVVFSAARHNEVAQEVLGDDGWPMGSLTYAVTRELGRLQPAQLDSGDANHVDPERDSGEGVDRMSSAANDVPTATTGSEPPSSVRRLWTYRRLHERVLWVMAGLVWNQPQVEGDIDTLVFGSGLVVPEPYVDVAYVAEDGRTARVAAGTLAGFMVGTRIEVHREGTLRPSPHSRLVSGTVIRSASTEAVVRLESDAERQADRSELEQGRAFITHHTFGPLRLTVQLSGVAPDFAARLSRLLEERVSAVELVAERAEIIVRVEGAADAANANEVRVVVETAADCVPLLPPTRLSTPGLEERIGRRLLDYARNRYLRSLHLEDPAFQVDLEIVPVHAVGCQGEPVDFTSCSGFEDFDPGGPIVAEGVQVWRPGDLYRLRAAHHGSWAAHLNVLDLQPDGVIRLLWPPESTRDQTALAPGHSWNLPGYFVVTEPAGVELLLLIASQEWIDLSPFVTRDVLSDSGAPRGHLGPFAPLFDDTAIRARSSPIYPGGIHIDALTLRVAGKDHSLPPCGARTYGSGLARWEQ